MHNGLKRPLPRNVLSEEVFQGTEANHAYQLLEKVKTQASGETNKAMGILNAFSSH